MKKVIDIDSLLAPIPGDNRAGEDLRYTPIYDSVKEARRADDLLDRGDWQRELKTSDWDKVISVAVDALSQKSKDLQIAVWFIEGLIWKEGFGGVAVGLKVLQGLLREYWDQLYPAIDEEDLEGRAAPLEFLNDRLSPALRQIPLTDAGVSPGYSFLKWQEASEVGYESGLVSRAGGVDEHKKAKRNEWIAEGKLTAEEFDSAVARTSKSFYESLVKDLTVCWDTLKEIDQLVDEKFGDQAPRLSDFGAALEECLRVVLKIFKEQKGGTEVSKKPGMAERKTNIQPLAGEEKKTTGSELPLEAPKASMPPTAIAPFPTGEFGDGDSVETHLWEEALNLMKTSSIRDALGKLLGASNSASSVRTRTRYRLLMAKLCLEADRLDLARPIMEEVNRLIEELHLERWESPLWLAEVLDALYQCLTRGQPTDEDLNRAKAILERLCTTDVTKAMIYRS